MRHNRVPLAPPVAPPWALRLASLPPPVEALVAAREAPQATRRSGLALIRALAEDEEVRPAIRLRAAVELHRHEAAQPDPLEAESAERELRAWFEAAAGGDRAWAE